MSEKPILFSAPMIRALLNNTKTQTRRALKNVTTSTIRWWEHTPVDGMWRAHDGLGQVGSLPCPYGGIGTRLWVRETWQAHPSWVGTKPSLIDPHQVIYRADDTDDLSALLGGIWRPSIFMPKWASRITLEITDVRCERLQAISQYDAMAEGITLTTAPPIPTYAHLWDSINGAGAWAKNPWVFALTFRRVQS